MTPDTEQLIERYPHELRVWFDGATPTRAVIEGVEFVPHALIAELEEALDELCASVEREDELNGSISSTLMGDVRIGRAALKATGANHD
jgi:hypothetical protein